MDEEKRLELPAELAQALAAYIQAHKTLVKAISRYPGTQDALRGFAGALFPGMYSGYEDA